MLLCTDTTHATDHYHTLTVCVYLCVVHVSFEKYRSLPDSYLHDDDDSPSPDDSDEDVEDFERVAETTPSKSRRRSKGVPVGTATKHDPEICGRRNVKNMEKFPPDFPAGDMSDESKDFRLPNSVFNTLRAHSQKEEKYVRSYLACLCS